MIASGVCVIVQARLGSTRLPKKALLQLGKITLLEHVLNSARQIAADHFVLACDYGSVSKFKPIAQEYGFRCVGGSEENVLSRFALVIETCDQLKTREKIQAVVRITADNPFLFVPAIEASVRRFFELGKPDYFTFTGLPHGSGMEILKADSLLTANKVSTSSYEQEHVGPSLYHHTDKFRCIRETAPIPWYFPDFRTTVDTNEDYLQARHIIKYFTKQGISLPASPQEIMDAVNYANRLCVFVPSISAGLGSGHLRRIIDIVSELQDTTRCEIFINNYELPKFAKELLKSVPDSCLIKEMPKKAAVIILDKFKTSAEEMLELKKIAPIVAIDEGGKGRSHADYLLDILPSLITTSKVTNILHESIRPNLFEPAFIPLPQRRRFSKKKIKNSKPVFLKPEKTKTLVVCGGEDSKRMALPIGKTLVSLGFNVTVIDPNLSFEDINQGQGKLKLLASLPNLKEKLADWDLVITQYGFTAFEALAAGCFVLLTSPTDYHYELSKSVGFSVIETGLPTKYQLSVAFTEGIKIPKIITPLSQQKKLSKLIGKLTYAHSYNCPVSTHDTDSYPLPETIVSRLPDRTIRKCSDCELHYLSFIMAEQKKYTKNYFFDEYKAQYGKTYIEDFENIRQQGLRRINIIDDLYDKIFHKKTEYNIFSFEKKILDIGCAYGPFVHAAKSKGWFAVGTDIASSAVDYVSNELNIPAFLSAFPALPASFEHKYKRRIFGNDMSTIQIPLTDQSFSAISMWFVIEHFSDLDSVLQKVADLLVPGGIFAFSTPTLSGITGKQTPHKFFQQSPKDHFSIWDAQSITKVLGKYGFQVCKQVSIGHHPERFYNFEHTKKCNLSWKILNKISKQFKLGDSIEVYAMKRGSIKDIN